jgi:hypothetical protein
MAKYEAKTKATAADPRLFLDKIKNETKRKDSHELATMMEDITGEPAKMWGSSIVGFGTHRYHYASGHEGVICAAGFAPRSGSIVVYLGSGIDNEELMSKLGKHKTGKGCLYINKLDDVDRKVLRKLIEHSLKTLRERRSE